MSNWLFSMSFLNYNPTIFNVHIHITLYFFYSWYVYICFFLIHTHLSAYFFIFCFLCYGVPNFKHHAKVTRHLNKVHYYYYYYYTSSILWSALWPNHGKKMKHFHLSINTAIKASHFAYQELPVRKNIFSHVDLPPGLETPGVSKMSSQARNCTINLN